MPIGDSLILICLAGLFIVVGIFLIIWGSIGRQDEGVGSVSAGSDVRRFLEPQSTKSVSMIIGGLVALLCGLGLLAVGLIFSP